MATAAVIMLSSAFCLHDNDVFIVIVGVAVEVVLIVAAAADAAVVLVMGCL